MAILRRIWRDAVRRLTSVVRTLTQDEWVVYRHAAPNRIVEISAAERGPLLALLALVILSIIVPSRVWAVLLVGLGAALALAFTWALLTGLRMRFTRRTVYAWVQVGDRLEEDFALENNAPFPVLAAEIDDHSTLPGYQASTVRAADHYAHYHWRQTAISRQRGLFQLGPTVVRYGDPLGLFAVRCNYTYSKEVLVYPPVLDQLPIPPLSGGGQGQASTRQRSLAETAAIGGVRDYHPGDPIRRIHWPLTMRHGSLLIKEFDREMGGHIWLALDLHHAVHAGEGEHSTLEYGVIWAASWAWHFLRAGKSVGLYCYGPSRLIVPPRDGNQHLWLLLRTLATVDARGDIPLAALLHEIGPRLGRGDALAIVTPSLSPDWPEVLVQPGLRGAAKAVTLLDAASFESGAVPTDPRPSVMQMRALLASLSVPTQLVERQDTLPTRPLATGTGNWEFISTPWGKVVARRRPTQVAS
jgi:uncharacterized protein (DUF58 family)